MQMITVDLHVVQTSAYRLNSELRKDLVRSGVVMGVFSFFYRASVCCRATQAKAFTWTEHSAGGSFPSETVQKEAWPRQKDIDATSIGIGFTDAVIVGETGDWLAGESDCGVAIGNSYKLGGPDKHNTM